MIEINNYSKNIPRTLILEIDDELPQNPHYFKGKKFEWIFIHKDNKYKEDFKLLLNPTINVLGYEIGQWNEYE